MAADPPELVPELDRLYQLPPPAFVAARNDLAKRLRTAGERDAAARVATLARPSAPVWAINQLYWERRELWDALVGSAARLRLAQGGAGGTALAHALASRREAVAEARRAAMRRIAGTGAALTAALERRLGSTIEALASGAGEEVVPGRLTVELEPPGFDLLSSAPSVATPTGSEVDAARAPRGEDEESERSVRVEEATAAAARARSELAAAARRLEAAAADHEAARVRSQAAADQIADAERQLERSRFRAREAEGRLAAAARQLAAAEHAKRDAAAALASAERRLERARKPASEDEDE